MLISELIKSLQLIQDEWGDIKVLCAPFSLSRDSMEKRESRPRCWWCGSRKPDMVSLAAPVHSPPNLSMRINRDELSREPEPSVWGYPGLGNVRHDGNPAREVIL